MSNLSDQDPSLDLAFTVKGVRPLPWLPVRDLLQEAGVSVVTKDEAGEVPIRQLTPAEITNLGFVSLLLEVAREKPSDSMEAARAKAAAQWFFDREMNGEIVEVALAPVILTKWEAFHE